MITIKNDEDRNVAGQEIILQIANRRLLDMRRRYQSWRAKIENNNCVEKGRDIGVGKQATLKNLLKVLVRETRSRLSKIDEGSELFSAWSEISGAEIANATIKVVLRNGFLNVTMNNHILKHEIESFRKERLLSDMRKRLVNKIIRDIRVKIGN